LPKFKESDSRASGSSAKAQEVVEGEVYDLHVLNVAVFADICFPGEVEEERSGEEESDEQESGEESEESYEEEESEGESESDDEEVKTQEVDEEDGEELEDKNRRGLKRRCSSGKTSDDL